MDINKINAIVEDSGIIFLTYGGFLSQSLISAMTEALEKEVEANDVRMGISSNIFTIFIELAQNMMNYSKSKNADCRELVPSGLIVISKDKEGNYYIDSQNIVSIDDKKNMEPKLIEVTTLDRDGIKKKYKELLRSGQGTHARGGGVGFYEIAKRCDKVEYNFTKINDAKYYFHIKTQNIIKNKGK